MHRRSSVGYAWTVAALVAIASSGSATSVFAQTPDIEVGRFLISVTVGPLRSTDAKLREVYGSAQWPINVEFTGRIANGVEAFLGVKRTAASGEPIVTVMPVVGGASESFQTSLKLSSVRGGLLLNVRRNRLQAAFGAGVCVDYFSEAWQGLPISVSGHVPGFITVGAARFFVTRRLLLVARGEYSIANSHAGTTDHATVGLGGFGVGWGVGLRF